MLKLFEFLSSHKSRAAKMKNIAQNSAVIAAASRKFKKLVIKAAIRQAAKASETGFSEP